MGKRWLHYRDENEYYIGLKYAYYAILGRKVRKSRG